MSLESERQSFYINLKQDAAWVMHRLHFHGSLELLLMLSDEGEVFFDRDIYPLRKNTLLVLGANTLHRTATSKGNAMFRRYSFHILPSLVEDLSTPRTDFSAILRAAPPCTQLEEEQAQQLAALFEQLHTPASGTAFGEDIRQQITLLQILLLACRSVQTGTAETGISNPDYDKVQPMLAYIQQNFTEPLALDDLARHFLVSKHYLCHMFKKGTGFSVMEYVIQLRIIEAQRLLRLGSTVQEAGENAGFQSYAHFIRTFNTYTGTSPKQYAMQFKNGDQYDMATQNFHSLPPL